MYNKLQRIRHTLEYQELIAWYVKSYLMTHAPLKGYVKLTAKFFISPVNGKLPEQRGDLDNFLKSCVDGLQYGGMFAPKPGNKKGNDRCIIRFGSGTGIYISENERTEIELEEISL